MANKTDDPKPVEPVIEIESVDPIEPVDEVIEEIEPVDEIGQKINELERVLRSGNDLETACHYAELSVTVVYAMLEQGKVEAERRLNTGETITDLDDAVRLWEVLRKARADAIVRNVTIVQKAAQNGNWNAAKWWLENHMPEVYGRKDKTDKQGKKELE